MAGSLVESLPDLDIIHQVGLWAFTQPCLPSPEFRPITFGHTVSFVGRGTVLPFGVPFVMAPYSSVFFVGWAVLPYLSWACLAPGLLAVTSCIFNSCSLNRSASPQWPPKSFSHQLCAPPNFVSLLSLHSQLHLPTLIGQLYSKIFFLCQITSF